MKIEFVDIDELLAGYDHKPRYKDADTVDMYVVDGMAHVRVYRGSDTHDVDGITWWTTDKKLALGTYYQGVLLERVISIPVIGNVIANPSGYVIGNKDGLPDVPQGYSYGVDNNIDVTNVRHFNISINKSALNLITKEEY